MPMAMKNDARPHYRDQPDTRLKRRKVDPGSKSCYGSSMEFAPQLPEAGIARLKEICRRFDVQELSVFGSTIRGEDRADSDIDCLVDFVPGAHVGLLRFQSLIDELEALFGRPVDLVTKRGLKPLIRSEVLRESRVIYAA